MVLQHCDLAVDRLDPLVDPIFSYINTVDAASCCTILGDDDRKLVVAYLVGAGDLRLVIDQLQDVLRLLIDEPLAVFNSFSDDVLSEVH